MATKFTQFIKVVRSSHNFNVVSIKELKFKLNYHVFTRQANL